MPSRRTNISLRADPNHSTIHAKQIGQAQDVGLLDWRAYERLVPRQTKGPVTEMLIDM